VVDQTPDGSPRGHRVQMLHGGRDHMGAVMKSGQSASVIAGLSIKHMHAIKGRRSRQRAQGLQLRKASCRGLGKGKPISVPIGRSPSVLAVQTAGQGGYQLTQGLLCVAIWCADHAPSGPSVTPPRVQKPSRQREMRQYYRRIPQSLAGPSWPCPPRADQARGACVPMRGYRRGVSVSRQVITAIDSKKATHCSGMVGPIFRSRQVTAAK